MIKYCNTCKNVLNPETNWRPCNIKQGFLQCADCLSANRKKYYKKNQKRIQSLQKKRNNDNPRRAMFLRIRAKCKKLRLDFNLEESDIVIPKTCPLLEEPLITGVWSQMNPSLDRIDNFKGYIKGNIRVISRLANTMKNCATKQQLMTFALHIVDEGW